MILKEQIHDFIINQTQKINEVFKKDIQKDDESKEYAEDFMKDTFYERFYEKPKKGKG